MGYTRSTERPCLRPVPALIRGGAFLFVARCISVLHIPIMAKASSKAVVVKGSRAEHPRLVGFSEDENALVERAASKCGVKANPFIREAAVFQAREELGLKHPKGELT